MPRAAIPRIRSRPANNSLGADIPTGPCASVKTRLRRFRPALLISAGLAVAAVADPDLPGGEGSVDLVPFPSFESPLTTLTSEQKRRFFAGKALAGQPWVKAPATTTARDGLGPLYNARSCLACHTGGGRGKLPEDEAGVVNRALVKISVPGNDPVLGVRPEPTYGDQLQTQSTALMHQLKHRMPQPQAGRHEVRPEAYIGIRWHYKTVSYPDGQLLELRWPELNIKQLGYGALAENTHFSLRVPPPLYGLGLLEAIPSEDVQRLADPEDRNGDGISGRINRVWNFDQQGPASGRFGAKATRSDLTDFTAAAFANDVGISNPLFPSQPCTASEMDCQFNPTGNDEDGVELPRRLLELVVDFTAHIAVPKARPLPADVRAQGQTLFHKSGCADCHTPQFTTGAMPRSNALAGQDIWPYTDLLLHDLGPDLADQRPDYDASGREWRTPPLWGVGLQTGTDQPLYLLHDGRARTIEEAIWWHGGEAQSAKHAFVQLPASHRQTLIQFIQAL